MKLVYLNKSLPLLSSLFIIFLITINNQKEDTTLKILIWNTPSFSLGTYIAIASCTGGILSYMLTSSFAISNQSKLSHQIKYKIDNQKESPDLDQETSQEFLYDNTFIERDIKDPTPTMNASFRVISRTNRERQVLKNETLNQTPSSDMSEENDYNYYKQQNNYKVDNEINPISDDWDDYTYINW